MSNIRTLPDAATLQREASTWIARLHADDVTEGDLARFEAWRATSARHARAFEDMAGTVMEVKRAKRIVDAVSFGNTIQAAADPEPMGDPHVAARPARRMVRYLGVGVAAMLLAMATGVLLWWSDPYVGQPRTQFQTALGEHATVELPDGSRLDLNTNSAARVEYTQGSRIIHLTRGEAFFTVAHDVQRPFWVVAGDSWIRAVGTAFNVDLRSTGVRVVVSEGTVKVAATSLRERTPSDASLAKESVSILSAGQQAEMRTGLSKIRPVTPLELTRLAAWRKGKLYFENQPLGTVVEELGRYTDAQILIEDDALRQLPIGGTFQANSQGVEALLDMLREGLDVQIRRDGNARIYIEGATGRR